MEKEKFMETEKIPMPPSEIENWGRKKPEDNNWADLWTGTKAMFRITLRLFINIGVWTWKIFAFLINWIMKWTKNMEKDSNAKMKEQEKRMREFDANNR